MSIMLLQGPLGPFFNKLQTSLELEGYDVHRFAFNGGDQFFGHSSAIFNGHFSDWRKCFLKSVRENDIKLVIAYGDCRALHIEAKRMCQSEGVQYFALEEGYLRPNYITIEDGGVNGHSPITRNSVLEYTPVHSPEDEVHVPGNFLRRIVYAIGYYGAGLIYRLRYSHYLHHRSFSAVYEPACWIRAGFRKYLYKLTEPRTDALVKKGDFFLVPLQVHNDAQIQFHSAYDEMEDFIVGVMESFSYEQLSERLIFKHHPMDRGHVNYSKLIAKKAQELGLSDRVDYIHDQHLPTLLKHCKGVVTINSTTALQAFYHRAAVKVMGDAFFDMEGLTHQGDLSSFWHDPIKPDAIFSDQFKAYLLDHGQINGSFYCQYSMTIRNLISYLKKLKVI